MTGKTKRRPKPPPVRAHDYIGDGVPDRPGGPDRCLFCGLPEDRTDIHTTNQPGGQDARQLGAHDQERD